MLSAGQQSICSFGCYNIEMKVHFFNHQLQKKLAMKYGYYAAFSFSLTFSGDEIFPLGPTLMKPYARTDIMGVEEKVFNYRYTCNVFLQSIVALKTTIDQPHVFFWTAVCHIVNI